MKKNLFWLFSILLIAVFVLSACGGAEEPATMEEPVAEEEAMVEEMVDCKGETAAETEGAYQIPAAIEGCYKRGFCLRWPSR